MKFLALSTFAASAQALSLFTFLDQMVEQQSFVSTSSPTSKIPVPGNSNFTNCEAGRPQFLNITDLTLEPALPAPGSSVTVSANVTALTNVTEGSYVDVMVKFGLNGIYKNRLDLCSLVSEVGLECPILAGSNVTFSHEFDLPASMPAGEYIVIAKAYANTTEMLTCLFTDVVLGAEEQ